MNRRRKIAEDVAADVLIKSRRRCCICFALRGVDNVKKGQIAHLDRDPSNNDPDNLAFMCRDHHDEYDTRPSQSKGFTPLEVKAYRAELLKYLKIRFSNKIPRPIGNRRGGLALR